MATKNSKKPTKAKKPAAKKVTKVQKKPVKKLYLRLILFEDFYHLTQ